MNHFLRLYGLGYTQLVPITPPKCPISEKSSMMARIKRGDDARGKAPGMRWPDGTWSGFDWIPHVADHADLLKWDQWGAGCGIKTGNGLVLIDADTLNEDQAAIIKRHVENHFGQLPIRIGRYPKVGYVLRTDPDFTYRRIEFGERDDKGRLKDRVEILADGRQFVAEGTHPHTGLPYRWPSPLPKLEDVPFADTARVVAFLSACAADLPQASEIREEGGGNQVSQQSLTLTLDRIKALVTNTANTSDRFPTREAWLKYGYAIKGAAGPHNELAARDLWLDFCDKWEDGINDRDLAIAEWQRMKAPFRVGASHLMQSATTGEQTGVAIAFFEKPDPDPGLFGPNPFTGNSGVSNGKPKRVLRLVPFAEAAASALSVSAKPLIKGVLDQGAMSIVYGDSNTGKTFCALSLASHIAAGEPWLTHRVTAAPVLYVAAEGGHSIRKRIAALNGRLGAREGISFVIEPVNLLRADADLGPVVDAARAAGNVAKSFYEKSGWRGGCGLIVIDTLSRAMAGGDENSSVDMGAMVKHLDAVRAATGAHVMAVHHSGKDRAKGARGHSLLRAATDTELEVEPGMMRATKQRDHDLGGEYGFALAGVVLGVDDDGDPVTSAVCEWGAGRAMGLDGADGLAGLTGREREALNAAEFIEAGRPDGNARGFTASELMDELRGGGWGDSAKARPWTLDATRHVVRDLTRKGMVGKLRRGEFHTLSEKRSGGFGSAITDPKRISENEVAESGENLPPLLFQ